MLNGNGVDFGEGDLIKVSENLHVVLSWLMARI
jgi:hypothetical protein